jgi:hypothetical protein
VSHDRRIQAGCKTAVKMILKFIEGEGNALQEKALGGERVFQTGGIEVIVFVSKPFIN